MLTSSCVIVRTMSGLSDSEYAQSEMQPSECPTAKTRPSGRQVIHVTVGVRSVHSDYPSAIEQKRRMDLHLYSGMSHLLVLLAEAASRTS